jgi:hypothetical protein
MRHAMDECALPADMQAVLDQAFLRMANFFRNG